MNDLLIFASGIVTGIILIIIVIEWRTGFFASFIECKIYEIKNKNKIK